MHAESRQKLAEVYSHTNLRVTLKDYEEIDCVLVNDQMMMVYISTYQVKTLVREDRFLKRGKRVLVLQKNINSGVWHEVDQMVVWDTNFEPFVYEKIGRRKTAEEFTDQREWEKLCHRPGTAKNPLDSYDRVLGDPKYTSKKMERYW